VIKLSLQKGWNPLEISRSNHFRKLLQHLSPKHPSSSIFYLGKGLDLMHKAALLSPQTASLDVIILTELLLLNLLTLLAILTEVVLVQLQS
jgi:hypothetical protein